MPYLLEPVRAPDFALPARQWLPPSPRSLASEKGRVVLLDFFDVTLVNCLRRMRYLRRWKGRYQEHRFCLIGVHVPEFPFGRDPEPMAAEIARRQIDWPVVLDPDRVIWQRYSNRVWPASYLVDARGFLRFY